MIQDREAARKAGRTAFYSSEESLLAALEEAVRGHDEEAFAENGPLDRVFIPLNYTDYVPLSFHTLNRIMELLRSQRSPHKRRFLAKVVSCGLWGRTGRTEDPQEEQRFLAHATDFLRQNDPDVAVLPFLAAVGSGFDRTMDPAFLGSLRTIASDSRRSVAIRTGAAIILSREAVIWDNASLDVVLGLLRDPDVEMQRAIVFTLPYVAVDKDARSAARASILQALSEWLAANPPGNVKGLEMSIGEVFVSSMLDDRAYLGQALVGGTLIEQASALTVLCRTDVQLGSEEANSVMRIAEGRGPIWLRRLAVEALFPVGLNDVYAQQALSVARSLAETEPDQELRARAQSIADFIAGMMRHK